MARDPWDVLGVGRDASVEEVRAAFRRLAAEHHPDRLAAADAGTRRRAAERMAEINAAYRAARQALGATKETSPAPSAASPAAPPVTAPGPRAPVGCAAVAAVVAVIVAVTAGAALLVARGDRSPTEPAGPATTAPRAEEEQLPPPWAEERLPASAALLAVSAWRGSPASLACPLLVPSGADRQGSSRLLDTPGGWGVAWDVEGAPGVDSAGARCDTCGRATFGITARPPKGDPAADRGLELAWTDGSTAVVTDDGGRLVASLRVEGVDCSYRVFSSLGFHHLAEVLGALRFVNTR